MSGAFSRAVSADLVRTGTKRTEVAKAMDVHLDTLSSHLREPDRLTVRELRILSRYVSRATILLVCPWWDANKGGQ